jgi:hypothetical protein
MAIAGPNRVLRVIVEDGRPDRETMASVAHELEHVREVLAEPSVRSGFGMFALYKRNGAVRGETFETKAAVNTGAAVYKELKQRVK